MGVLIYACSPNKDGLTAECAGRALQGIRDAGAEGEIVWLNEQGIGLCRACDRGWGTCLEQHVCQVQDGFQALHERTRGAEGYVLVSPVYWGELSESAKAFTDRLRRCEATRKPQSALARKLIIGVAAAGGSGGGTTTCLDQMNRLFMHLQCDVVDLITVTRKSRAHKAAAIAAAGAVLAGALAKRPG